MTLKGMLGTLVGTVIGGEAIRQVGNAKDFPTGLKSATQSFIALGVVGNAAKKTKSIFKFK